MNESPLFRKEGGFCANGDHLRQITLGRATDRLIHSKQPARIFLRLFRRFRLAFAEHAHDCAAPFLHLDIDRIQLDEDCITAEFRCHVADRATPRKTIENRAVLGTAGEDARADEIGGEDGVMWLTT